MNRKEGAPQLVTRPEFVPNPEETIIVNLAEQQKIRGRRPHRSPDETLRSIQDRFKTNDIGGILTTMYTHGKMTGQDIATYLDTPLPKVYQYLKTYNIPIAPSEQRTTKKMERITSSIQRRFHTEDIGSILNTLYTYAKLSAPEISKYLDVGVASIYELLHEHNIPVRPAGVATRAIHQRPIRSKEIAAKVHTPENTTRRINAWRNSEYVKTGEAKKVGLNNISKARNKLIKDVQERIIKAFGTTDIKEALRRMHYFECMTLDQIADQTKLPQWKVQDLFNQYKVESITPDSRWIEKNREVGEILPDIWKNPDLMSQLRPNHRYVLERRHLSEGRVPTLEEVGKELGVTRERVRQIEYTAISKLQRLTGQSK